MNDELPPPITQIHLPPPYRRGRGDTAVLIFLGAVIVLGIWKMGAMLSSPEPFALPVQTSAVPVTTITDAQGDVFHVVVDNLTALPQTTAPRPTPASNTPIPYCPVKVGQICQIPPAVVVVTPTEPILCDATAMPLMSPGVVCQWRIAPTFVPTPTPGGFFK